MNKILGIEFGSTRIKAVLVDENGTVLSKGAYRWENSLVDGLWSYDMKDAVIGMQTAYKELKADYESKTGTKLTHLDALGISAMMHGYLPFDKDGNQLVPFRTWRNINTPEAEKELSELFNFHIPMRWSVSHYYQSLLENQPHINSVARLYTLSGYIHYLLSGSYTQSIGDASGMFPCDGKDYDADMLEKFNSLLKKHGLNVNFKDLLPKPLQAGEIAGTLTEQGAKLLDVSGELQGGVPMCPPEGDMQTGQVATNTVRPKTGNISAGTSVNLTMVLDKPLSRYYRECDVVCSSCGYPTAMFHSNNGTGEIDQWVSLFGELLESFGVKKTMGELYGTLYRKSAESDFDIGKLVATNSVAGEMFAGLDDGYLMMGRTPDGDLTLANFMQAQIYACLAPLSLGLGILKEEKITLSKICGHGGFYSTPGIGQIATSAMLKTPVTVQSTAGEGGPYGIALLALYMLTRKGTLPDFLDKLYENTENNTAMADETQRAKFDAFLKRYKKALPSIRTLSKKDTL